MRCRPAATIQRLYKHALPLQNFAALTSQCYHISIIKTFLLNSPSKVSPTCHAWGLMLPMEMLGETLEGSSRDIVLHALKLRPDSMKAPS
ncbi:hypothetical protein V6N13_134741 [Hibiscus sabdariffa]|uniref:Uncharacterized protein n=1 Tax=Hibiscus sabdariffa TaxID=183260 RepID=A0ABR2R4N9_9ROSI